MNDQYDEFDEQALHLIVYVDEEAIRKEADEITDKVLVKLITEEYNQGAVSVKRLAGIIIRLVPATDELRRILSARNLNHYFKGIVNQMLLFFLSMFTI